MRRPYFRSANLTWYVQIGRKQHPLGKDPRFAAPPATKPRQPPPEIQKKYLALMQREGEPEDRTLSFCVDEYLASLEDCTPSTRWRARHFLGIFAAAVGDLPVAKLKSHHVDLALKGKAWKPNSVHAFIVRIDACLNYCARKGWIDANPLKGKTEKPTPQRREEVMRPDDRRKLIEGSEGCFRDALIFLDGTGTRPIEARTARVEKCDLEKGVIMVPNKTRKKTGAKERPIFLSTRMIEHCRTLVGGRHEGWLLRNKFGGQWTKTALEHRLQRLCAKLGIDHGAALYSYRHGWASSAINDKGMNPALVAIQLGHTDLKMLLKTYLHSDPEAMRKALDE